MKHLLSKSKTIALLALSLLTGIGVFSGVSANNKNFEKASAAGETTYYAYLYESAWGGWGGITWARFMNSSKTSTYDVGASYGLSISGTTATNICVASVSVSWEPKYVIFVRGGSVGDWSYGGYKQTSDLSYTSSSHQTFYITTDGYNHDGESGDKIYHVETSSNGNGSATCNYEHALQNNSVKFTATPNSGYQFSKWSDNSTTNPYTKTITGNTNLSATFEPIPAETYSVKYWVNSGSGTNKTFQYNVGSSTTAKDPSSPDISFTAPSGKKFKEWNTNSSGTGTSYSIGATISSQAKDSTFNLYAIWQDYDPSNGYWIEFFNSPRSPQRVKLTHNGGTTAATSEWTAADVALSPGDEFKIVRYESESIPSGQYWGTKYIDDNSNSATAADQIAKKTEGYVDNDITVSVVGNYDFTFHDYYDLSKLYIDSIKYQVTYHVNGGTAASGDYVIHPKVGKDFITEDIDKAKFTPPSGSEFKEWNTKSDGTGTAYTVGATVTGLAQDENLDLYAIWKGAKYTITYYRVINGTYMDWWGSKTIENVPAGTYYYNLESENIYGFGFDGWYSNQQCTVGLSNSQVLENKTVYAKFSSTTDSRQIYAFIPSSANYALENLTYGNNHTMSIWMQKDTEHVTKDVHMQKVGDFTSGHLYTIALPNDATGFSFHAGLANQAMQDGKRSVWLNPQNIGENNMYVFNNSTVTEDSQQRYDGEWKSCYFQFQMSSTDGNWESATKLGMNAPTSMSSGNDAELTNVNVTTSASYFRVAVVINGTEEPITTTGTDLNTLNVVTTSGSHQFKDTITLVNVYLKNKTIYLVDAKDIAAGGYLYISTDANPSNIKISVTVTKDDGTDVTPFSNNSITTVSGISTTTTLKYDNVEGMIRIPIFNLRGSTSILQTDTTYRVILDGNEFELDQVIDSSSYWINLETMTTPVKNTPDAKGAKAAFNLDKAILGSKNTSVCNCSQATAQSIVADFNAANGSSKLPNAEINTYKSTLDSEKGYINIMGPYGQIQAIAQHGENAFPNNLHYSSLLKSEDQSILIIVIASSGLLLLSASALLLFLRKRKNEVQ